MSRDTETNSNSADVNTLALLIRSRAKQAYRVAAELRQLAGQLEAALTTDTTKGNGE